MTKEPIMIDDVDVSECNFTLERDGKIKCECTHSTGFGVICDCESWKTCHYKKWKRLENEYEGFVVKYTDMEIALKRKEEQLDQLKADNEELKKDYAIAKSMYDLCQSDFMELAKIKDKYEQALQEIKGIVFELMKADKSYKFDKYSSKILQKCEVIE